MDGTERYCALGPDRAEAGSSEYAAVYQVLSEAKFHHQKRLPIDGGKLDQRLVRMGGCVPR